VWVWVCVCVCVCVCVWREQASSDGGARRLAWLVSSDCLVGVFHSVASYSHTASITGGRGIYSVAHLLHSTYSQEEGQQHSTMQNLLPY